MTNEELLAAIRLIVREELRAKNEIDPPDMITGGPSEDGAVRFLGVEEINANCWVLTPITIRQANEGRIPPLNKQQLVTIMMNVGCDENGDLQPIFGRGYGQTGNPAIDEMSPQANKVVHAPTFWQPNRYVFGDAFKQSDTDRVICSRSKDFDTLLESVRGLGSLHVNDGSAFKPN